MKVRDIPAALDAIRAASLFPAPVSFAIEAARLRRVLESELEAAQEVTRSIFARHAVADAAGEKRIKRGTPTAELYDAEVEEVLDQPVDQVLTTTRGQVVAFLEKVPDQPGAIDVLYGLEPLFPKTE